VGVRRVPRERDGPGLDLEALALHVELAGLQRDLTGDVRRLLELDRELAAEAPPASRRKGPSGFRTTRPFTPCRSCPSCGMPRSPSVRATEPLIAGFWF